MAGYRGHIIGGVVVFALVAVANYFLELAGWITVAVSFPVLIAYSLLPDIDAPASKVRKYVDVALLLLVIGLIYLGYPVLAIPVVLALIMLHFVKHRGVLHSPVTGLVLSAPIMFYSLEVGAVAFIGYLTHLVVDRVT